MRIFYVQALEEEIGDAPAGTAIFNPRQAEVVVRDVRLRPTPARWVPIMPSVNDPARVRLVLFGQEVENCTAAFKKALRKAWSKLPKSRRGRGVFGVCLRGDPTVLPRGVRSYRTISFFHVPSFRKWKALYPTGEWQSATPAGYPTTIGRTPRCRVGTCPRSTTKTSPCTQSPA